MPLQRPTLAELVERAVSDIETRLPGVDARLRRSNLAVLAKVHAGAVHGLYGLLEFIARQVMPDTAEVEYLERWASVWGVARTPASKASGDVTFTGTDGTVVPASTVLLRSDGAEFETEAQAVIAAGSATVAATALVAGIEGNTDAGSLLTLNSPVAGVNGTATVAAGGIAAGTDAEGDDALRLRLVQRIQQPPHGGAESDYVPWAKEVAGVTRAWVYPAELGLGTVTVRFVRDGDVDPIPAAGALSDVQDYIDERRPVTAEVLVLAPIAVPMDFTIALSPDTAAVREAVEAELLDLLTREAEPGGTILLTHISEAISVAAGEDNHVLTVPNADVAHAVGELAVMGVITWA